MVAKFELSDDSVVVIIGTGAGGGVLANELAQKGVKVVALEAGGRYLPEDFINDEWESFFAGQRGMPYKQVAVDPAGKVAGTNKDGTVTDSWDFPGKVKVSSGKDSWCVRIAVRMSDLVPGGIKPGETLYYNVIRSVKTQAAGCWIPTFSGYHAPDRFGELYLVPKR